MDVRLDQILIQHAPLSSALTKQQTGMIKEHDRGLCDLRIYGKGMSIYLDVEPGVPVATPEKPVAHTLGAFWLCVSGCGTQCTWESTDSLSPHHTDIKQAKAKIHSMSLRLYESKHDTLYAIFKPFIKNQARKVGSDTCTKSLEFRGPTSHTTQQNPPNTRRSSAPWSSTWWSTSRTSTSA